eukprot:GHVP01034497.1.p1 GENE.GHVP01034497.1~~GHVP01034497.1.p1  ORF type:complete len:256 (+),score=29.99 GHVP01034497.1:319-1086(+)
MELKSLEDQLNSACEDFGIPQASGITLRDELHQVNSLEPEFEAIRWKNGTLLQVPYRGAKTEDDKNNLNREDFIRETLINVCQNSEKYFVRDASNDDHVGSSDLVFRKGSSESTLFFFEEPQVRSGRRYWKIRLCNCGNISLKNSSGNHPCESSRAKICRTLEISYNLEMDAIQQERVCQELWKAFEVAPGKSQGKYSSLSFGKEPKQQEDDRLLMDYYTQHDFAEIKKELTFDIEIEYSLIESLDDPRSYNIEE